MTVNIEIPTTTKEGDGVTTLFPFTFSYRAANTQYSSNLIVYIKKDGLGQETLDESRYTVIPNEAGNGGEIEFPILESDDILVAGDLITTDRQTNLDQGLLLRDSEAVNNLDLMYQLDKVTRQQAEQAVELDRAVKVQPTSDDDPDELIETIVDAEASCSADAVSTAADAVSTAADADRAEAAAASIDLPDSPTAGDYLKYGSGGYETDTQPTTNAANIATNAADIATNTSDIATNTSDIAANNVYPRIPEGGIVESTTDDTVSVTSGRVLSADGTANIDIAANAALQDTGLLADTTYHVNVNSSGVSSISTSVGTGTNRRVGSFITDASGDIIPHKTREENGVVRVLLDDFVSEGDFYAGGTADLAVPDGIELRPLWSYRQNNDTGANVYTSYFADGYLVSSIRSASVDRYNNYDTVDYLYTDTATLAITYDNISDNFLVYTLGWIDGRTV